jgi:hypothetical protein
MQWQHRKDSNRCKPFLLPLRVRVPRVPHEPQRADRPGASVFWLYPFARQRAQRVSIRHIFTGPTRAFGDFGHSCERRSEGGTRDTGTARRDPAESSDAFEHVLLQ